MPWLQNKTETTGGAFLVHIPRTGGTSLTRTAKVAQRARANKSCLKRCLLTYFQYRYWIYENQAWPIFTIENLISLIMIGSGVVLYYYAPGAKALPFPYVMWSVAIFSLFCTSYVFTPMGLRVRLFAKALLWIGEYLFSARDVVYGMNKVSI